METQERKPQSEHRKNDCLLKRIRTIRSLSVIALGITIVTGYLLLLA